MDQTETYRNQDQTATSRSLTPYQQRVFVFIDSMPFHKVHKVDDLAKTETRQQFVETIKLYIDSFDYGGGVSFLREDCKELWRCRLP